MTRRASFAIPPRILLKAAAAWALAAAAGAGDLLSLKTSTGAFVVGDSGHLTAIPGNGRNCLATNQPAPLAQVRVAGKWLLPQSATKGASDSSLTLHYAGGVSLTLKAAECESHVRFEIVAAQPRECVELVLWGPYPVTIDQIIGEVVGVVRDDEWAVGIQALNAKTLGGYPSSENDNDNGGSFDDPGRYGDLPPELNRGQTLRGDTALPKPFGSVLQAYCRARSRERVVENWGLPRYCVLPFDDGGVVGSKLALFACPALRALETIGRIEVAEGLPHPLIDGVWGKTAPSANSSYLIVDFGESNIEQAIAMTRRAGLRYLYHSSPFETWGHFRLKPGLFPHGRDGLRECVAKARAAGVSVGFHTLSNFITPNDPYVTPEPDARLARIGSSALAADADAAAKELVLESADCFAGKTALNGVVIGGELIRYAAVEGNRLVGCQRGAWGTPAAAHRRGESVGRLMDHAYKVFLTDADLLREVARNIADLCNYAGIRQISMDGLEGAWSTGYGQYGRTLFAEAWYRALTPEARSARSDASNPGHFNWHINTYYNWGEPWYAGFRESQTLYRFKNQLFYTRNLLPRMLGWFALRPNTSLADAEWLLARSAGYDAGFALATSFDSAAQQKAGSVEAMEPRKAAILDAVRIWEGARMARAFPEKIRARLRDNRLEFQLEAAGEGQWILYPVEAGRWGDAIRLGGGAGTAR